MDDLIEAVRDLEHSSYQFNEAKKSVPRDGFGRRMLLDEETKLYVAVVGGTWAAYLQAGGSRTMINHQLERKLDFGQF